MASCSADECKAYCCGYISVHLDAPKTKVDFDEIMWFVAHENISVYKDEEGKWLVEVVTPCKFLKNNRCEIYETRPQVCREYDPGECSKCDEETEKQVLFRTPEDVLEYKRKRWGGKKKKNVKVGPAARETRMKRGEIVPYNEPLAARGMQ